MSDRELRQITRYLLGEMPEEEADRLEARMLSEPQLFELAEVAEDDLVDRYARGELAPQERRRFERRLLPSERIRERLAFARLVAAWPRWSTRSTPAAPAAPAKPARERSGGMLRGLFANLSAAPPRLAWAAALIATIAASVLALNTWRLDDSLVAAERARAAAEGRAASAEQWTARPEASASPTPVDPVASVAPAEPAAADSGAGSDPSAASPVGLATDLAATREQVAALERENAALTRAAADRRGRPPGKDKTAASAFLSLASRSRSTPTRLALGDAAHAELALDLEGVPRAGALDATVKHRGVIVWREEGLPQADAGDSVILTVPRQALQPGRYRIDLTVSGNLEHLVGSYELEIEN